MSTLFEDIKAANIPFSNHESDLYFKSTPESIEILAKYLNERPSRFINQAPPDKGSVWIEVHFAYLPWWEARTSL